MNSKKLEPFLIAFAYLCANADFSMTIGICNDHAGLECKTALLEYLLKKGHKVVNFGTDSPESCDYPDFAHPMSEALQKGELDCGIAICGTGNGMAITLNHCRGIRAGLAWNCAVARLVKQHNDANVLVIPARFVSLRMAVMMTRTYLQTSFEGGRHLRRMEKITIQ